MAELYTIEQSTESASKLVLYFQNTDLLSLTPGAPNSIYDGDGTALILAGGQGIQDPTPTAACAVLAAPPGAPSSGSGLRTGPSSGFLWPLAGAVALALLAMEGWSRWRLSRGGDGPLIDALSGSGEWLDLALVGVATPALLTAQLEARLRGSSRTAA